MILCDVEMQHALGGGIGLCLSETVSFDGHRQPLAALWRVGDEVWFDSHTTDVRTHIPVSLLQAARDGPGKIEVLGVGLITFAAGDLRR